jgi:hypothetical protein
MTSLFFDLMQDIVSVHSSCKLLQEEEYTFIMAYHYKDNVIKYNIERLQSSKQDIKEFKNLNFETYFELCLYHELGHYLDYKNNKDRALVRETNDDPDNNFKFIGEQNAWKFGREIIPSRLQVDFDLLNESNLNFWKNKITKL